MTAGGPTSHPHIRPIRPTGTPAANAWPATAQKYGAARVRCGSLSITTPHAHARRRRAASAPVQLLLRHVGEEARPRHDRGRRGGKGRSEGGGQLLLVAAVARADGRVAGRRRRGVAGRRAVPGAGGGRLLLLLLLLLLPAAAAAALLLLLLVGGGGARPLRLERNRCLVRLCRRPLGGVLDRRHRATAA